MDTLYRPGDVRDRGLEVSFSNDGKMKVAVVVANIPHRLIELYAPFENVHEQLVSKLSRICWLLHYATFHINRWLLTNLFHRNHICAINGEKYHICKWLPNMRGQIDYVRPKLRVNLPPIYGGAETIEQGNYVKIKPKRGSVWRTTPQINSYGLYLANYVEMVFYSKIQFYRNLSNKIEKSDSTGMPLLTIR